MSAFKISATPPRKPNESREPTLVLLGPFTPKATVLFEGVPIGKTARRVLIVKNVQPTAVKVLLTKIPKPEFFLSFEWTSTELEAGEQKTLEVVWNPQQMVVSKQTLNITDTCGNHKDVSFILKTVEVKRVVKKPSKPKLVSTKLCLKSPSPPRVQLRRTVLPKKSPICIKSEIPDIPEMAIPNIVLGTSNISNVLNANEFTFDSRMLAPKQEAKENKENRHPSPPKNASRMGTDFKFSPMNDRDISYLANLPTPSLDYDRKDPRLTMNLFSVRKQLPVSPDTHKTDPHQRCLETTPNTRLAKGLDALCAMKTPSPRIETDIDKLCLEKTPSVQLTGNLSTLCAMKTPSPMFSEIIRLAEEKTPEGHLQTIFDPNSFSTIAKPTGPGTVDGETFELRENHRELVFSPDVLKQVKEEMSTSGTTVNMQLVIDKIFADTQENRDHVIVFNKTHPVEVDSSPQLSMIAEENSREFGITYHAGLEHSRTLNQRTFKVIGDDNLSHIKSSSDENLTKNVTMNVQSRHSQGSLPNLDRSTGYEEDAFGGRLFKEHEIRAQSSRFNIDEVGRNSDEPIVPCAASGSVKRSLKVSNGDEVTCIKTEMLEIILSPPKRSRTVSNASLESLAVSTSSSNASTTKEHKFAKPTVLRSSYKSTFQSSKHPRSQSLSLKRPATILPPKSAEKRVFLYNSDRHLKTLINPDPFAATMTSDPFLSVTMYMDERTFEKYEKQLKKWLNALVSIPADLDTEPNKPIDVGKLFDEVKGKDVALAPTKELTSSKYYKNRLNDLRNAGIALYRSEMVANPLRKIHVQIEKKTMTLRSDRNLHLDLVLQRNILELLLCFNPLWLRLGLEVTFGEQIELQSNRDVVGLSTFIVNRLFKDRYLEARNGRAYSLTPAYADHMKKFTFRMFLFLLLFLDTAKNRKLIKHNPCLFVKNAPYKETREILIRFSSYLIAGIGDITKNLKRLGYVLTHKQTFLDEFDYAFHNLAGDLRDGVKLTRVMEIILLRDDLSRSLRVPCISRLQKIHNVNLALKALEEANYQIVGDITAKDICDGHREKSLSLLWQIIYKFRSPKFNAAASTIQCWWRKKWLGVLIARRIERKREMQRDRAARKIQSAWRGHRTRLWVQRMKQQRIRAATTVQTAWRRYLAQKVAAQRFEAILRIQQWWRTIQETRTTRERFLLYRKSALLLQTSYRRHVLAKKLQAAAVVIARIKDEARIKHEKALVIQRNLKSYVLHRKLHAIVAQIVTINRTKAVEYRSATTIQAYARMVQTRRKFLRVRTACISIQVRWRECLQMKRIRSEYLLLRSTAIIVQRRFRAQLAMHRDRSAFGKMRESVSKIQRKWRATVQMRSDRNRFLQLQRCCIAVQAQFRANKAMERERANFIALRNAALVVQRRHRANRQMHHERQKFRSMKSAVVTVQRRFRAQLAMRETRGQFLRTLTAIRTIQMRFRATVSMHRQRMQYLTLHRNVIIVQRWYRAILLGKQQKQQYMRLQEATITIQRMWRATLLANRASQEYRAKRNAAIAIQRAWRNVLFTRRTRSEYTRRRAASLTIQRFYRGLLLTRRNRAIFQQQRAAAITIQRKLRATIEMRRQRDHYRMLHRATVLLQCKFRATQLARHERTQFLRLRQAAVSVSRFWRARQAMHAQRTAYMHLRQTAINVQRRYRALCAMRTQRSRYLKLRATVVLVQRIYRAQRLMVRARGQFLNLQSATILIQDYFRAYMLMKRQRTAYNQLRVSTIRVQQRYRATILMRQQRTSYLRQREAACSIQRHFRGYLQTKQQQQRFTEWRNAALVLQRNFRARCAMQVERQLFVTLKQATVTIQRRWRATLVMRRHSETYQQRIRAIQTIQRGYRAYRLRLVDEAQYRLYRSAVIVVQRRFRAKLLMQRERSRYVALQATVLALQTRARGVLARRAFNALFTPEYKNARARQKAALRIQTWWRGTWHRRKHQTKEMRKISEKLMKHRTLLMRDPTHRVSYTLLNCMKFMKYRYNVSEAINILLRIERISRLVPHLLVDDANFLSTFCYTTMSQAIRSEIDKQVIEICARIILNMARFAGTKKEAFKEKGLVTVSQMLLRWCDKDCGIFITLCTLLWVLSHDCSKKNAIRRYMISRDAIFMLRETKKLVQRKEKMRRNVKKPHGCLAPPNPQLLRMVPALEPDYGVIRNKPYVFYSTVFAFDTVLRVLEVDIS